MLKEGICFSLFSPKLPTLVWWYLSQGICLTRGAFASLHKCNCPVLYMNKQIILYYGIFQRSTTAMHCLLTKAPTLHVVCCTVWLWCVCLTNSHRDQTETSPFPVRLQINEAFKWRSESSSASLSTGEQRHTVSLLQVHDICVLNSCGSMFLLHEIQLSLMHEQTAALWKYTGSIRLSPVSFHLHAVFSSDRLELFLEHQGASPDCLPSQTFTLFSTEPER